MFDIQVYGASGEFIGVDVDYTAEACQEAAAAWMSRGYTVKVVPSDSTKDDGANVQ